MNRLIVPMIFLMFAAITPARAQPRDLHDYWDARCQSCHGHSAAFARRTLRVEQGRLIGKHHRDDLQLFLKNHYLTDELVEPVTAMLVAQATAAPLFQARCAGCHGNAADFARKSLLLQDGVVTGKASGRPVDEYLRKHGGLAPEDIEPMVETLTRVLGEVGGDGR